MNKATINRWQIFDKVTQTKTKDNFTSWKNESYEILSVEYFMHRVFLYGDYQYFELIAYFVRVLYLYA